MILDGPVGWIVRNFAPQVEEPIQLAADLEAAVKPVLLRHGIVLTGLDLRRIDHIQIGLNRVNPSFAIKPDGVLGPATEAALGQVRGVAALGAQIKALGEEVYVP